MDVSWKPASLLVIWLALLLQVAGALPAPAGLPVLAVMLAGALALHSRTPQRV